MPVIKQLGIQPGLTPEYIRRERDLIKQINDALAGQDATIAALRAEPVCFAHAAGTTNGVGGVTPLNQFGGTLEVQGNNVALRFTTTRPSDEYIFGAMWLNPIAERVPVGASLAARTREVCVVRFYDGATNIVPANLTAFSFMIWAIGPRA